jgi:hypothetical protein
MHSPPTSVRRGAGGAPPALPPPLPRTFPISSAGWLLATLALVAVFTITFAASRHSAALAITAADDRVVQWFAGLRSPWLTRVIRGAALAGSWGRSGRWYGAPSFRCWCSSASAT